MVTNNDIRRFLGEEETSKSFSVYEVDSLGDNHENTLMFINKSNISLSELDSSNRNCVFLMSEDHPAIAFSEYNDFIRIKNPKFAFCWVVDNFCLRSRLQNRFTYTFPEYSRKDWSKHEIYCDECVLGENVQIDQGAIIGGTDFSPVLGNTPDELIQFPQMGGVKIGNNVVIKYNSMIGKGTFGYTEIGDNTMIDFGCQIGHNCIIGKSCIIAAGTIIGGSTTVGDNTVIGIGAKIRNGIKIGERSNIGMGAVVIKDVPPGCTVVGNPARIIDHAPIFDERGLV